MASRKMPGAHCAVAGEQRSCLLDMRDLEGKAALVTGAGTRVGAAIAIALAHRGANVGVHFHGSRAGAEETAHAVHQAGGRAELFRADLSDRAQIGPLITQSRATLGRLDVLVPSAANFERIPFDAIDDGAWDRALRLNLDAAFWLVHHARHSLREVRGNVVIVTCTSATVPYRHYLPYVVLKGAARALMRALAIELAPHVRVNAVAPGTVLPPADMEASAVDRLAARIPLGRVGTAEDVADAVTYLPTVPFVTGQEILVDGGRSVSAEPSI